VKVVKWYVIVWTFKFSRSGCFCGAFVCVVHCAFWYRCVCVFCMACHFNGIRRTVFYHYFVVLLTWVTLQCAKLLHFIRYRCFLVSYLSVLFRAVSTAFSATVATIFARRLSFSVIFYPQGIASSKWIWGYASQQILHLHILFTFLVACRRNKIGSVATTVGASK